MGCFSSKPHERPEAPTDDSNWDGAIRSIRPWKVEPAITSQQLERLRNEFWETRVEGRKEMWQALRFAAEADSEELCNETVKAAGLRPANRRGTLQSMFDERGALYEIPMYALLAPTNLDEQPTHIEFKDAARAIADYIETHDRSRLRVTRQA
eukprot:GFKZ01010282.1.p2 GENE.GFKZ01010282.1~~GFKZ01010282.1.p2  ORF type:complete len:153 (-),score=22.08 GFKZ01010282.1:377-835(-)